jgi:hypothetical protein
MTNIFKIVGIVKSEYFGSDLELFAGQLGSRSKNQTKMGSGYGFGSEKNSFGSTTLMCSKLKFITYI